MYTAKVDIKNLSWLRVREEERYIGTGSCAVFDDANWRGINILEEILGSFPDLIRFVSLPEAQQGDCGRTKYFQEVDLYLSDPTLVTVAKRVADFPHLIPQQDGNRNGLDRKLFRRALRKISDLTLFIVDPNKQRCGGYIHRIEDILNSYKVDDTVDRMHEYTIELA